MAPAHLGRELEVVKLGLELLVVAGAATDQHAARREPAVQHLLTVAVRERVPNLLNNAELVLERQRRFGGTNERIERTRILEILEEKARSVAEPLGVVVRHLQDAGVVADGRQNARFAFGRA